ncbi:hypothetical protein NEUTE1DRAFT_114735 [Neurospora tetrasperma FGSC 2508]|uniref:Uncharacterized protein n=1 Tax=Neurospora tetrasperma (strain FGSC 2508 / ATCC MYA-4615 / P0657) TaxID=510951 RepID=F8MZ33_NEUT8|nr:uncharacterized protein NEUTE1DRAFT_114735 [Neurospora tetrasperma FGSC 2508]EGO52828.1 hypothetical protein NEUTE1DRAFT_114735 [Neurospora tetrasperma FGSC 2508]
MFVVPYWNRTRNAAFLRRFFVSTPTAPSSAFLPLLRPISPFASPLLRFVAPVYILIKSDLVILRYNCIVKFPNNKEYTIFKLKIGAVLTVVTYPRSPVWLWSVYWIYSVPYIVLNLYLSLITYNIYYSPKEGCSQLENK